MLALRRFICLDSRGSTPRHPEASIPTDHILDYFGLGSLSDLPDVDSRTLRGLLDPLDVRGPLGLPSTGAEASVAIETA